jgi:hypothetical protein
MAARGARRCVADEEGRRGEDERCCGKKYHADGEGGPAVWFHEAPHCRSRRGRGQIAGAMRPGLASWARRPASLSASSRSLPRSLPDDGRCSAGFGRFDIELSTSTSSPIHCFHLSSATAGLWPFHAIDPITRCLITEWACSKSAWPMDDASAPWLAGRSWRLPGVDHDGCRDAILSS